MFSIAIQSTAGGPCCCVLFSDKRCGRWSPFDVDLHAGLLHKQQPAQPLQVLPGLGIRSRLHADAGSQGLQLRLRSNRCCHTPAKLQQFASAESAMIKRTAWPVLPA